jgi:membrane fusion protein (multidrug efflux system)
MKARMQQHRKTLMIGVPVLFLIGIAVVYFMSGRYVSTDDAYVQAAKAGINANVSGQVTKIYVKENQRVNQGDILFELDSRPFTIAIDNAKAQLVNAQLQVLVLKANFYGALAKKIEAESNFTYVKREYKRQKDLSKAGITSDMDLNKISNQFRIAREQVQVAEQGMIAAKADLNNDPLIPVNEHPVVKSAQAQLDGANLQYEYSVVKAPFSGYVTKVDQLQPGDSIGAGQPVFALVSDSDIWVEANFKETQITHMKAGQYVKIEVDAYPDETFSGRVLSLSPGTGSSFSILPPENATGNWVKIVQRVPVRISIGNKKENVFLSTGLSTTVTVDTESRKG